MAQAEAPEAPKEEVKPIEVPLTVEQLILKKANEFGVSPTTALRVAKCESNYDRLAKNKNSSASGIFQFLDSTWNVVNKKRGVHYDKWNAEQNIENAMWLAKNVGWSQWECK